MKAIIKAVLTDPEALQVKGGFDQFGKLREPVVRFVANGCAHSTRAPTTESFAGTTPGIPPRNWPNRRCIALGVQTFPPGYIPATARWGAFGLVNPEAQITNETTVAGI